MNPSCVPPSPLLREEEEPEEDEVGASWWRWQTGKILLCFVYHRHCTGIDYSAGPLMIWLEGRGGSEEE